MDRSEEHLGAGDEGIIVFRKLLRDQIEAVRRGRDPLGVVRRADKNAILEFDVINERIGVYRRDRQKVA